MKRLSFYWFILALSLTTTGFQGLAMASEVNLQLLDPTTGNIIGADANPLEICPGPITILDVQIKVTNLGASTDTYKLSIMDLPEGWNGQIQTGFTLATAETKVLDLFLINTNIPEKEGEYTVTIEAKSMSVGSDADKEKLKIKILPCYVVEMEIVNESYKESCEEDAGPVEFVLKIKNNGKYADAFDLKTSPEWAKLSQPAVSVGANQSEDIVLKLDPPGGLLGTHSVLISAQSRTVGYNRDCAMVQLKIDDCYSFSVNLEGGAEKPADTVDGNVTGEETAEGDTGKVNITPGPSVTGAVGNETGNRLDSYGIIIPIIIVIIIVIVVYILIRW